MNSDDIVTVIRRGATSMSESLRFYWPSCGENDVLERNISIHVGSALLASGFFLYAEAHNEGDAKWHLDLLGLHRDHSTLVAAEFKRLWNPKTAREMAEDLARLRAWRLTQARVHPEFRVTHRYGVLAATTWDHRYVGWFADAAKRTADPSGGGLAALSRSISGDDVRWGSTLILNDAPVEIRGPTDEWLVYVVFPL